MSEPAIAVRALTKDYNGFRAVDSIDFKIEDGKIFGFLGPNGAGKTTTIKMLCTLLNPTLGEAFVAGYNVVKNPMEVRRAIGIIFQEPTLDDRLTAYENLDFHGILYGLKSAFRKKQIQEMLELVGLSDKAKNLVKTFSGGMKRRLELARGLMHIPRILFLDEPTIGLDPQTRLHLWDYLVTLRKNRSFTLFLTTHYMEEAENCDEIAVIDQGKIIAEGSPDQLKANIKGDLIYLKTRDDEKASQWLKSQYHLAPVLDESGLEISMEEPEKHLPGLLRDLPVAVEKLSVHRPTLEDVFIQLTGREIREETGTWADRVRVMMRHKRRSR